MISIEKNLVRKHRKVPEYLVFEIMDGKPIYYRDYKSVLNKNRTLDDIIGTSSLQSVIITFISRVLHTFLIEENYWMMLGGTGMYLNDKNNLIGDILICEKSRLKASDINNNYLKVPPNVVMEIDTRAHLSIITFKEYLKLKTTKLHNFGVDKVIWIMTETRQVIIGLPAQDWLTIDWNKDIEIINGITFNIGNCLRENGIELQEE